MTRRNDNELLACLTGELLDEHSQLSLVELSRLTKLPPETVMEFVEEGLIEPTSETPATQEYGPSQWRFTAISVQRVRCARRLTRDLRVNTAGAALALELLEEIQALRATLQRLES